jgi:hypothetical protein
MSETLPVSYTTAETVTRIISADLAPRRSVLTIRTAPFVSLRAGAWTGFHEWRAAQASACRATCCASHRERRWRRALVALTRPIPKPGAARATHQPAKRLTYGEAG